MNASYIGELAALGAAFMWSFSSIFFTIGGRHVGAVMVNRVRLLLAVLFVGVTHWLILGRPFPVDAGLFRFGWLSLSAMVGLVIGDSLLFQAYLLVGPRIGVLLLSLAPVFGTLLAWIFLGERLAPAELGAMALALGGVAWVVLERGGTDGAQKAHGRSYALGILFGLGAGFCQAANLVLAKPALAGSFPALSAVMIRMSVAMAVMWLLAALRGEAGRTIRRVRADQQAGLAILAGAFIGPFVGVWLSLIAVQATRVGIATTLMAMSPVLSLPLVHLAFKEQVTSRAVFGTLAAMAGVAWMILI